MENVKSTYNEVNKDRVKALASEIKHGRKHIKENSAKHANYCYQIQKGTLTWKELNEFHSKISSNEKASKEARIRNMISAFLNGTPFAKVETYHYVDGKPVRFDGKEVTSKKAGECWRQREEHFNEAVNEAKAEVPEELKPEFDIWLR